MVEPRQTRPKTPTRMEGETRPRAALRLLGQALEEGRFCLIVGAGASMDVGAQGWPQIITALAERCGLFADCSVPASYSCAINSSPHVSAKRDEIVRRAIVGSGADLPWLYDVFEAGQSEHLAELVYGKSVDREWTQRPAFLQSAPFWLAVLAIACAWRNVAAPFHVITYNVDLLLEEAIEALGHQAITISRSGAGRLCGKDVAPHRVWWKGQGRANQLLIRVFHPHGFVDRKGPPVDPVMGAGAYDWLASSPLDIASTTQLMAFGSRTCLFYGFSFRDYSVRRLLRFAHQLHLRSLGPTRHIGLLRCPSCDPTKDECVPDSSIQPARQRLYYGEARLLREQLGVELHGGYSHVQHKRFVITLLRLLNETLAPVRLEWPR